jgi:hypothetical protein
MSLGYYASAKGITRNLSRRVTFFDVFGGGTRLLGRDGPLFEVEGARAGTRI